MPLTAANIVSDVMQGASEVEQYNRTGIASYLKFDRVFLIDGMNRYSSKRQAMNDAKALIKILYPVTSECPNNALALARGYASAPTNSDDVVQVTLSYIYSDVPVSSTQWTIEVTDFFETVDTDTELALPNGLQHSSANSSYVPSGGSANTTDPIITTAPSSPLPIQVDYYPDWQYGQEYPPNQKSHPANGSSPSYQTGLALTSFAHVSVFRPRKRLVFTRTVYGDTQARAIEAAGDTYECTLNSIKFRNRAPGVWLCTSCNIIYQPYEGSNLARLEFVSRPAVEGWHPWVRYSNPLFGGTPPNVFRLTPKGASGNGIRKSIQFLSADHNALLALLPGGVKGDPSTGP